MRKYRRTIFPDYRRFSRKRRLNLFCKVLPTAEVRRHPLCVRLVRTWIQKTVLCQAGLRLGPGLTPHRAAPGPNGRGTSYMPCDNPCRWHSPPHVYFNLDRFPKIGNPVIPQDREYVMTLNSPRPVVDASAQRNLFQIRCEAGEGNRFGVQADSITVTLGQRVLREGVLEMWDSVGVYAKQNPDGDLIVEVLVFNPEWDEPLRIASIRSRPEDKSSLTPLVCGLDHSTP